VTSCTVCNAELVQVPSGMVCPNGHGRILPRVRRTAREAALAALPVASRITSFGKFLASRIIRYTIAGHPGIYCRNCGPSDGVAARFRHQQWRFVRDVNLEVTIKGLAELCRQPETPLCGEG
jgi:DNA-directed RNA polymerase subunit RPC12/RpoP